MLRLQNGVYLQICTPYMFRVDIPYGHAVVKQLRSRALLRPIRRGLRPFHQRQKIQYKLISSPIAGMR